MAKVQAPLMSFGASGKIADALVFFPWKGLNVVRQYVIPANPQSPLQVAQRGYFEDAVDEWHLPKYSASDIAAWNRYAAILADPMSGFNAFVRDWINIQRTIVPLPDPIHGGYIGTGGAGLMNTSADEDGEATNVFLDWGYSKTALVNTVTLVEGPANTWILNGIAVQAGSRVYGRFWLYDAVALAGRSGIYQFDAV